VPSTDEDMSPLRYRMRRLWRGADTRGVPLRTIIAAVVVVAVAYLGALLVYRLRTVFLLFLVAGFIALLLNPAVTLLQRTVVRRRGLAVLLVTIIALLAFGGLLTAFGYPLVNGVTSLADKLPSYVASAQSGKGWIGHLVTKYHVQNWVQANAPKLATYAQEVTKPVLNIGKGAASVLIELFTIFVLVLLLLLEGPRLRKGILFALGRREGEEVTKIAAEVNRAVTGYMLGNFLTSLICGVVVFVTLMVMNVPYPLLWALWVALVDFLPMIGGALAGIPTVIFAYFTQGLTAGVVTLVVFLTYTQLENHILNPIIMSKTVRISPLLVLISVLVGAEMGNWVGGLFGGFVAALLSIPAAGALQVVVREAWRLTGPPQEALPQEARSPDRHPLPSHTERSLTISETLTIAETTNAGTPPPDQPEGGLEEDAGEDRADVPVPARRPE
jgi:predicted PurR-regulated permease PerM